MPSVCLPSSFANTGGGEYKWRGGALCLVERGHAVLGECKDEHWQRRRVSAPRLDSPWRNMIQCRKYIYSVHIVLDANDVGRHAWSACDAHRVQAAYVRVHVCARAGRLCVTPTRQLRRRCPAHLCACTTTRQLIGACEAHAAARTTTGAGSAEAGHPMAMFPNVPSHDPTAIGTASTPSVGTGEPVIGEVATLISA